MRIFLLLLLFAPCSGLRSQWMLGWNGGYANPKELNREIYVYNAINRSGLTKEMPYAHWYHGAVVGYRTKGDAFFEMKYIRKTCRIASEFDSAGVGMTRQLKVQSNFLTVGFGMVSDHFIFGGSFDFGGFKGKGRRGTQDNIGDERWKRLWVADNSIILRGQLGLTFYAGVEFGPLSVRPYAQLQLGRLIFDELDPWLFGTRLNRDHWNRDRFNNYGIEVVFILGKN